jgi:hypothetical protein
VAVRLGYADPPYIQWRESVEQCSSSNCPLHPVRPRSTSERIKTPVPLAKDAAPEPDPTPEPETDVGALLGGVFGRGA